MNTDIKEWVVKNCRENFEKEEKIINNQIV